MCPKPRDKPEKITLEAHRIEDLRRHLLQHNRAQYLSGLIEREPHLELITPWLEDSLCFRYVFDGIDELDLEGINRMILYELWSLKQENINEDKIQGKYVLEVSNISGGFSFQDLDILVEQISSIGDVLVREYC